jgi:hypothetical protein
LRLKIARANVCSDGIINEMIKRVDTERSDDDEVH